MHDYRDIVGWCVSDPEYDPHMLIVATSRLFQEVAMLLNWSKYHYISVIYYLHKPG